MFELVLRDIQERLFYCASKYISEEISGYKPSKLDLNYPERLLAKSDQPEDAAETEADGGKSTIYTAWFVTLERTLLSMSKVFRCVDPMTFNEVRF